GDRHRRCRAARRHRPAGSGHLQPPAAAPRPGPLAPGVDLRSPASQGATGPGGRRPGSLVGRIAGRSGLDHGGQVDGLRRGTVGSGAVAGPCRKAGKFHYAPGVLAPIRVEATPLDARRVL
ncbi:MAG: hypothetical protein AVDCRST_MAG73-1815, partial [uncultured Thermomicrobiales bacterium]